MTNILLVHLSDLHVGHGALPLPWPNGWTPPHQEGHDSLLCEGLELAYKGIRAALGVEREVPVCVVTSGDLTCRGDTGQFPLVRALLYGRLAWRGHARDFGLELGPGQGFEQPGNHDHWDGGAFLHAHNPKVATYFPWPTNPSPALVSRDGAFEVRLFGLDSSSGLAGGFNFSPTQTGKIDPADLVTLEANLKQHRQDATRHLVPVLVVHHTLAFSRVALTRPKSWATVRNRGFALRQSTRRELLQICSRNGVAAILTGHTHDVTRRSYPLRGAGGLSYIRELRAPSTTQDQPRRAQAAGALARERRGFLVHRLNRNRAGVMCWETWPLMWSVAGFSRAPKPLFRFRF